MLVVIAGPLLAAAVQLVADPRGPSPAPTQSAGPGCAGRGRAPWRLALPGRALQDVRLDTGGRRPMLRPPQRCRARRAPSPRAGRSRRGLLRQFGVNVSKLVRVLRGVLE